LQTSLPLMDEQQLSKGKCPHIDVASSHTTAPAESCAAASRQC